MSPSFAENSAVTLFLFLDISMSKVSYENAVSWKRVTKRFAAHSSFADTVSLFEDIVCMEFSSRPTPNGIGFEEPYAASPKNTGSENLSVSESWEIFGYR